MILKMAYRANHIWEKTIMRNIMMNSFNKKKKMNTKINLNRLMMKK